MDDEVRPMLVGNIIQWKKAPRLSREKIEYIIKGFFDEAGKVERVRDHYVITLPGRPAYLDGDDGWTWITNRNDTARWIRIDLEGADSILVRASVQDKFTLCLANAISELFYMVQGYEDQEAAK